MHTNELFIRILECVCVCVVYNKCRIKDIITNYSKTVSKALYMENQFKGKFYVLGLKIYEWDILTVKFNSSISFSK